MQQQNKDGSFSEVGWPATSRLKRTGHAEQERLCHERLQVRRVHEGTAQRMLVSFDLSAIERRLMRELIGSDIHAGEQ